MYYKTPTELLAMPLGSLQEKTIRLGGLVEVGSYRREELRHIFRISDGKNSINAIYTGVPPALFAEGQGVIADGYYRGSVFQAVRILAKHDENYKPPKISNIQ